MIIAGEKFTADKLYWRLLRVDEAMSKNLKVQKSQMDAVKPVLERLQASLSPEYLGLISSAGQPITVISSTQRIDSEAMAVLVSSSFAAASQLGSILENSGFTVMLHEGSELNIQVSQVTDNILLVICFRGFGELGRVRLITRRAARSLTRALNGGKTSGTD